MAAFKKGFPKRAMVFDFHTMHRVPDVGRDFNPAKFGQTLARANVDFAILSARCNRGFAYYPTRAGIAHPSLKTDLFGGMVKACRLHGIQVAAYFNAGIDHEHALRHRDWCKVDKEGRVYQFQNMGHFFRNPCLNTGYGDYLLKMIGEVLGRYAVDCLFLDCLDALNPCYGLECVAGMQAMGLDILKEADAREYTRRMTYAYVDKVKRLAYSKRGRNLRLFFNGLPFSIQPDHIEVEALPNIGWGYDYLPSAMRYVRTLGKPYFILTSRFQQDYGDFGGLCPEHSMRFDCLNAVANGGGGGVIDALHPRGALNPEVYRCIGRVFADLKALDPWTDGARAVTDMAIVDPAVSTARAGGGRDFAAPVQGATRMLWELKHQFDIVAGDSDLARYQVAVLPDTVVVDRALKRTLKRFVARGGALIASGSSGLDQSQSAFALPDYPVRYNGPEPMNPSFFKVLPPMDKDMPDMLLAIYKAGIAMAPKKGAATLARLIKPYFNKGAWDGLHENMYMPPDRDCGRPALVRRGRIFHFSFPVFAGYFDHAAIPYRTLVRNCLAQVLPRPLVKVAGLPSFAQVTVTSKGQLRMVHVLAYVPELRGKAQVVEEPIRLSNVSVSLRNQGGQVQAVYLAPSREPLPFVETAGYVTVTLPDVNGYQMIVFESKGRRLT